MGTVIVNPFVKGDRIEIPVGTSIHSAHSGTIRKCISSRDVTIVRALPGRVNVSDPKSPVVHLPEITWEGTFGQWLTVRVTPEFCEATGTGTPALPDVGSVSGDVAYGHGTDNRYITR